MPVVEDAATHATGDDRRLQYLRHLAQRSARVQGSAADHNDRMLGRGEELRRILDGTGVGRGRRGAGCRFDAVDVGFESEHVHRRLDRDGTGHSGSELVKRGAHQRRRLRRVLDALGPLGETAQNRKLVGNLVQQPVALADCMRGELSGDGEHRRTGAPGGSQRRGGVQYPRSGDDHVGADFRARLRIAHGHVGGRLLVAGVDDADAVALVVQCVEQRIKLDAGKSEHGVDAVHDERARDGPSGRHPRHCVLPKW